MGIAFAGVILLLGIALAIICVLKMRKKTTFKEISLLSQPTHTYASNPPAVVHLPPPQPNADSPAICERVRRTFGTSNYKRVYAGAKTATFQHYLLAAVNDTLLLYAQRINPSTDQETIILGVTELMEKIQDDAFKNNAALRDDADALAEFLWTSGKKHKVVNRMQLCSVLNAVIRDDVEEEIEAAALIFRSINSRRVERGEKNAVHQSYPLNGETWRGGGFRREYRSFFQSVKGKKYRVPGFLASSSDRRVAINFVFSADKTHPCALWRIKFDKRGELHPEYRVKHMTLVSKTLIAGEQEYLFAPYSVFLLVSVKWSSKLDKPHEFTLHPALDNKDEDEDLPLAPWY